MLMVVVSRRWIACTVRLKPVDSRLDSCVEAIYTAAVLAGIVEMIVKLTGQLCRSTRRLGEASPWVLVPMVVARLVRLCGAICSAVRLARLRAL